MSEHLISIDDARGDLLALAARLAESIKSGDGHATALSRIVPIFIAKNQVDLAAELSDTISDPFTRDRLLSQVAEKCAATDDLDYAFQLADAIEDVGIAAEARERIGLQQAAAGDAEGALTTAETLDHPDNVLHRLALLHDENGDAEKRDATLDSIEFPTARSAALISLASAALRADDKKKAVELLDRAVASAVEIDYETDEIRVLCDLGNMFVEANRKDRAIETFDKARQIAEKLDSVHREYLLSAISLGFFNAGSIDLADRVLDLIDDKTHMSATLLGFARGFQQREEMADALDALDEAYQILKSQHQSETRDSKAKFQLWRSVASQFAGFGKHERAMEAAQELPDEDQQDEALAEIALIATAQQEADFADQAFRAIADDSKRISALIGMADANRELGRDEESLGQIESAAAMVDSIPQLAIRSEIYNGLARRFADRGLNDRAREISGINLETILAIRDESVRAVAFADLAQVYEAMNFTLSDSEKEQLADLIRRADF